jgi:translation initiation factor 2 alpha subunit (eIF-2alpha)
METSDAMDNEKEIIRAGTADEIAQSLKRSSTHSKRRKGTPYQSAMSMLNFYINRAGRSLPKSRKSTLEQAKRKLREAFGRAP